MKHYIRILVGILAVVSFVGVGTTSAQEVKMVYLNSQRLLNESVGGKEAVKKLEAFKQEKQTEIAKREAALRKMNDEIIAKSSSMTPKAKEAKQAEYQKNLKDFAGFTKNAQEEFQKKYDTLLKPVKQDLDTIIADYGKKNNIDLIFDVRSEGIVYASERINITDAILKIYDEQSQAKTKKGSK